MKPRSKCMLYVLIHTSLSSFLNRMNMISVDFELSWCDESFFRTRVSLTSTFILILSTNCTESNGWWRKCTSHSGIPKYGNSQGLSILRVAVFLLLSSTLCPSLPNLLLPLLCPSLPYLLPFFFSSLPPPLFLTPQELLLSLQNAFHFPPFLALDEQWERGSLL